MANIAIQVKIGNTPTQWQKGFTLHFSTNDPDSKISMEQLKEHLSKGLEKTLNDFGITEFYEPQ